MKFLCDQCKAKYQIADEKVQGKTLRMKCRKCGHVIEIRAVAGASVPPPAGHGAGETMQLSALGEDAAMHALSMPAAPAAPQMMPAAKTTTATAIAPGKGAPPRPNPLANAPTRPGGIPRPDASQQTKPLAPKAASSVVKTPQPTESALANAFSRSVGAQPAAMQASAHPTDPPAEEWYVAIDEVPIGPIRLTDLRGKYNAGAIHDESLVWREGFEEWRPLRSLGELHSLVREEVSQPRGNLALTPVPRAAQPTRNTATPSPAASPNAFKQTAVSIAPSRDVIAARQALGNVIPIRHGGGPANAATARKIDEEDDDEVTRIGAQPIFPKKVEPAPAAAAPVAEAARPSLADLGQRASDPFASRDPFAPSPPAASPFAPAQGQAPQSPFLPMGPGTSLAPPAPLQPHEGSIVERLSVRAGVSKGLVALIGAACLLLGVVISVVVVKKMVQPATVVQEKVVEKEVQVPVSVMVPGTAPAPASLVTTDTSAASSKVAVKPTYTGGVANTAAPPAATSGTPNKKLSGIDLGPDGPDPTSTAPTSPSSDEPLDGKQVEIVAIKNKVGVTKSCYEKLVETGPANATVNIHVLPSGSVSGVDLLDGNPGTFGSCVQRLVGNWHFPTSGSGGVFRVPFVYK